MAGKLDGWIHKHTDGIDLRTNCFSGVIVAYSHNSQLHICMNRHISSEEVYLKIHNNIKSDNWREFVYVYSYITRGR